MNNFPHFARVMEDKRLPAQPESSSKLGDSVLLEPPRVS